MSIKGFRLTNGKTEKYDYNSLDDLPPLEEEIDDLKSALNYNELLSIANSDGVTTYIKDFSPGRVDSKTGGDNSGASNIRIRSPYISLVELTCLILKPISGYKFEVYLYDLDFTYKTYLGFTTNTRLLSPGQSAYDAYYVRIVLAKSDDTAIDQSEYKGLSVIFQPKLYGELSALKYEISNQREVLKCESETNFEIHFEQGSLSSGIKVLRETRIVSNFVYIGHLETISVQALNGYKLEVDVYNSDKSYKTYLGFTTEKRVLKCGDGPYDGMYLRFILCKPDDSTIVPSDSVGNFKVVAVSKLNKAIQSVYAKFKYDTNDIHNVDLWKLGSRNPAGEIRITNNRIVSDFFKVKKGSIVFTTWNLEQYYGKYFVDVMQFDWDLSLIKDDGFKRVVYEVKQDCIVSLIVRKLDEGDFSESEIKDVIEDVFITETPYNQTKWPFATNDTVISVNHRGWYQAPENTLPAYIESYQHGFKFVETDIRFTKDGIPVCLHDATLNRTCRNLDGTELSQTINVYDLTFDELQNYDAGIRVSKKYAGTTIPSLEDFLILCKSLNLLPYLDMGGTPAPLKSDIQNVVDIVAKCGLRDKVTYINGNMVVAMWYTQIQPNARIGLIASLNPVYVDYTPALMTGFNQVFMDTYYPELLDDRIEHCKEIGLPIETWTVNDTTIVDSLNPYVSGVTSDLIHVEQYLKSKNYLQLFTLPDIILNRAKNVIGGYRVEKNFVYINITFESAFTASNSPRLFVVPSPSTGYASLSRVEISLINDEEYFHDAGVCVVAQNHVFVDKIEEGKKYCISGCYDIS